MQGVRLLFKILFSERSAWRIIFLTLLSFSFSITVILCTIGLMDGFEKVLRSGLRSASGDLLFTSKSGFYSAQDDLEPILPFKQLSSVTHLIETEAFILHKDEAKGVLVRGVESDPFKLVTHLDLPVNETEIMVGEELYKDWGLTIGTDLVLTFAKGNPTSSDLPLIKSFKVKGMVKHGVYEKDSRMVYMNLKELQDLILVGDKVNLTLAKSHSDNLISPLADRFNEEHQEMWRVRPYWKEFSSLFEAVEVEKFSISLILQLIIVVAIFNIAAMMIYLSEKRAQEFFLVQALGIDKINLIKFWCFLFFNLWLVSCLFSVFLADAFDFMLQHSSFLKIPGDIYVIHDLKLALEWDDYLQVFSLSFFWILLVAFYVYRKIKKQPILQGLRMEYS